MSSPLDMNVCGDDYNRTYSTDLSILATTACLNRDKAKAQCARHLLVTESNSNKDAKTIVINNGIRYIPSTVNVPGKYIADKCNTSVYGGRRKRRIKKSKKCGKSNKSRGKRRRITQRRNR